MSLGLWQESSESTAHAFKPFCILSIELCIQTKHSYWKRKLHSLSVSDCVLCYWTSISIVYRSIIINFQLYIHTRRGPRTEFLHVFKSLLVQIKLSFLLKHNEDPEIYIQLEKKCDPLICGLFFIIASKNLIFEKN